MPPIMDHLVAQELAQSYPSTVRVAGVKIRDRGELKKFDAGNHLLAIGDRVLFNLAGELTYGVVYAIPQALPFAPPMRVIQPILRKATQEDAAAIQRYERLSAEGIKICREEAAALGLTMKLVEVVCAFHRRHMTFVYTADDRIDFRELVRRLARRFGGRIEMRQVTARDEASRLGGIDTCGLVLCCASFLTDITPVTIKQARKLGLPADDPKLLGVCGRLKCCLLFEAMDNQSGTGSASRSSTLITPAPIQPSSS
jgi:cell fate regulator YaaT (PSP1 superfamily)